ncbi:MAG: PEP-CTERM sorting domain-containing protein [Acidobacteriota bacterium]|nr:PEP-CTERM sorting domain-containing protein [Acidobacteriota bacterium]
MGRRIISIIFATAFCLLAARTAFAETIDFQSANASGGGQSGAQTSQGGSGTTARQVQTVDLGDVTGTVCDCGEIVPAGPPETPAKEGGFPKFPLLAFAVLPGIFPPNHPPNHPPSQPPETPTPEPLTVISFASGLTALAGLRSRRRRS